MAENGSIWSDLDSHKEAFLRRLDELDYHCGDDHNMKVLMAKRLECNGKHGEEGVESLSQSVLSCEEGFAWPVSCDDH